MAGKNPVTRIIITAKDEASAVFSTLRNHAGKIATAIAGYFTGKLFGDAVGSARGFEAAMSAVQAAAGASAEELAQLRRAAEQAGATTKYTSIEAAGALENLAKAGLSASDAVKTLPAVLNLAQAGGVDLATASEYVTKAVAGMGMSFAEAGRVADVLAMGANASNTSVQGLAQALSFAAPLANSLGLSLEQTVAIIGKFADAGIDAGRAGTALNSILAQFSDPASKFRGELAAAGIVTGDFDVALRQLAAAGPAGQKAILSVGQEAGPALRALLNQGIDSLDALKTKLDESAGSAATFAKVMGDNLDGAAKGFGSAWDALLIKVGTPVLETLKNQVNAVADRLREFVANGTAERFGLAIKSAFEAGGKWAEDFFGKVDFTKLAADMQAFATRAGEVFTAIGSYATTAGNTAQLAYGVMSAGINTVMTAVYSLGKGMSWLTSAFLSDLSSIAEGASKVTFGDMSRGFAEAAAKLKFEAQAAYAVSEEFGRKSGEAFAGIVSGTAMAATGWNGLTTASATSSTAIAADLKAVEEQATLTADQLDAIGESGQFIAGAVTQAAEAAVASSTAQQEAAAAAQQKIAELRAEYERLIQAGDTQRAGEVLLQLRSELAKTGAQAKVTADDVAAAFQRMGVTSEAELQRAASNARRDFEMIRDSGTASARDIRNAFAVYAEKAIAANNGVASSAIRAEASQRGMSVEVTSAGDRIVTAMAKAKAATDAVGGAASSAATGYDSMASAAQSAADAASSAAAPGTTGGTGGGTYKRMDFGQEAILSRAERLGGLELRKQIDEEWRNTAKMFNTFSSGSGLQKYFSMMGDTVDRLDKLQIEQEKSSGKFAANEPRVTGQTTSASPGTPVGTYRVEIGIGGGRTTAVNTATQSDADALVGLLQQLEEAAARS